MTNNNTTIKLLGIVVVVVLVLMALLFININNQIENAGGIKQIAVSVGKDVKDIAREIENH